MTSSSRRKFSRTSTKLQRSKILPVAPSNALVSLTIERLSHEGRGVAHYQPHHINEGVHPDAVGKTIFVRFALPNEQVHVQIERSHRRFDEGSAIQVHAEPSPQRVTPFCHYFGRCGGCALQHMQSTEQLAFKQQVVQAHFAHAGVRDHRTAWLAPLTSSTRHYRRRARFSLHFTTQLDIGFRQHDSHRVVDIAECPILHPCINQQLQVLRPVLEHLHVVRSLTELECVVGEPVVEEAKKHDEDTVAWIIHSSHRLTSHDQLQLQRLPERLQRCQISLKVADQPIVDLVQASKMLRYHLPDFNVSIDFLAQDFIQVNADMNQRMVGLAQHLLALKPGEQVLDLFCGLGNFALPAAQLVGPTGRVIAIEGVPDMVARAQINAKRQALHQVTFYCGDLTRPQTLTDVCRQHTLPIDHFDAIILDPPRSGAAALMDTLGQWQASRILYVSCDSATLARDLAILQRHGYDLTQVGIMDMFAHTEHIETIALLTRSSVSHCQ